MTEKETDEKMVAIICVYESPDITRGFYCEIPEKLRRFLIFEVSAFFKQWNYNEIELWGPNDEAYMFNLKQIITMLNSVYEFTPTFQEYHKIFKIDKTFFDIIEYLIEYMIDEFEEEGQLEKRNNLIKKIIEYDGMKYAKYYMDDEEDYNGN